MLIECTIQFSTRPETPVLGRAGSFGSESAPQHSRCMPKRTGTAGRAAHTVSRRASCCRRRMVLTSGIRRERRTAVARPGRRACRGRSSRGERRPQGRQGGGRGLPDPPRPGGPDRWARTERPARQAHPKQGPHAGRCSLRTYPEVCAAALPHGSGRSGDPGTRGCPEI